jgi:hypothetical protein
MITVRQLDLLDADLYRSVRLQAMKEDPDWFGVGSESETQPFDAKWAARASQLDTDRKAVFLAFADDAPCGLAEVSISDDDPHRPWLAPLWVASGHGRRAVNDALVGAACAWANTKGAHSIRVSFRPGVDLYMKVHCRRRETRSDSGRQER